MMRLSLGEVVCNSKFESIVTARSHVEVQKAEIRRRRRRRRRRRIGGGGKGRCMMG
jgi:hypothetical protein